MKKILLIVLIAIAAHVVRACPGSEIVAQMQDDYYTLRSVVHPEFLMREIPSIHNESSKISVVQSSESGEHTASPAVKIWRTYPALIPVMLLATFFCVLPVIPSKMGRRLTDIAMVVFPKIRNWSPFYLYRAAAVQSERKKVEQQVARKKETPKPAEIADGLLRKA